MPFVPDSGLDCNDPPDLLFPTSDSAGVTYNGNPVICGGDPITNSCFVFDPRLGTWTTLAKMIQKRQYPAGMQVNDKDFWISGNVE